MTPIVEESLFSSKTFFLVAGERPKEATADAFEKKFLKWKAWNGKRD
jgi:hypothetical protein